MSLESPSGAEGVVAGGGLDESGARVSPSFPADGAAGVSDRGGGGGGGGGGTLGSNPAGRSGKSRFHNFGS